METITPVAPGDELQQNQGDVTPSHDPKDTMQHKSFFRKWGGLVVLSLALAIIIIDTTLLNVSLKTIINDLDTNLKSMQWVITIYSLILAAFTITGGRLGDLFGRKRMFMVGAVIFAVGSFFASISHSIGMMIAGEAIIEGIGAALMMPATASLLITNFKGRDRSIAFGVWGGIAAASSAIGPILGGWLTTNYSWRWGFRINILVVALVLLGAFLIKENHSLRTKSKIDFVGVILSSLGLLSMVFGFIQASTYGWFKVKEQLVVFGNTIDLGQLSATPIFIVIGLIILAAFILWERAYERKGKTPLLSLSLFKNTQFVSGASTMAVLALGQAGLFFTIPVFLQAVRHLDALHTGLTLLPMSLALLVAAPLSAFLVKYIRPKPLVQIGMVMSLIAFFVLRSVLSVDATAWSLAPGFIIFGFGMGLIMAQVSNLTLSAVSPKEAGEASGVNNTLRMVGQTLGSAILGAILLSVLVTKVTTGINESKVIPNTVKEFMAAGVQTHVSDISFGAANSSEANNGNPVIAQELSRIIDKSTVEANKTVMIYGMIFIALGLLVSTRLPNVSAHGSENESEHNGNAGDTDAEEELEDKPTALAAATAVVEAEQNTEFAPGHAPTPAKMIVPDYTRENIPVPDSVPAPAPVVAPEPAIEQVPAIVAQEAPAAPLAAASSVALTPRKSRAKLWGGVALVVIVVAGLLFANKKAKDGRENTPEVITDTEPSVDSNIDSDPRNMILNPPEDIQVDAPEVINEPSVETPSPVPSSTPTPSPAPQTSSTYNDTNLHFAFSKPNDWKIVKNSDGEIVFKSAGALYNVQSVSSADSDWDSLRTFLEDLPNISNVRKAKFGSRELWQFDIAGNYQTGYAFFESGRLYYVLGMGSENTPLASMSTF